jgi:tRNA U34 5-methylaminomethyl-2-thiouridine-forming methyltransferase MnmC
MDFTGKLGKYKIIETEDRTKTLWSEFFNEACHNLSGAYEETVYNYILGSHVDEQLKAAQNVHVLDVGFGVGIGLKAFIDEIKKNETQNLELSYTSIELDEDLFLWSAKETFPDYIFQKKNNTYVSQVALRRNSPLSITIFIGDGRLTLPEAFHKGLLPKFTAIFQDAFSPKRNPMLWTVEWFNDLRIMSDPDVFMSTYSASESVRKSMIKANWKLKNQKGFGQKRTMTKARLLGVTDESISADLARSPTLELRDN